MQSKQFAVAGIVVGSVMTGLGAVVLLSGLAEAEQPDHDPVTGYEEVGTGYPDVDPLPSQPASKPTGKQSAEPSARSSTGSLGEHEGERDEPAQPIPTSVGEPDRPSAPRETAEPADPGGSTPTSGPTRTAEPEPSPEPTDPSDPTSEPTPTETATPTAEPQ